MEDDVYGFDIGDGRGAAYNKGHTGASYGDVDDIDLLRAQLDQKEKDLMLAAELGKALLEKNTDLEKKIELANEEFSQRIEELEQERYGLHLKLENLQGEYELTVKELQYDVTQARDELERAVLDAQHDEKNNTRRIQTLAQQNERLSEELQQAHIREKQLGTSLQSRQEASLAGHVAQQAAQIEVLQEQNASLDKMKNDLERHLAKVREDKDAIMSALEETQEKVMVLEKRKRELETQIEQKEDDIRHLNERNSHLLTQVDSLTEKASNSSGHSMTLFNELTQLSGNNDVTMTTDSPISQYPPSMFGEDAIECDDDEDFLMTSSSPTKYDDNKHFQQKISDYQNDKHMEDEILSAYRHLRKLCQDIRLHMGDRIEHADEDQTEDSGSETGSLLDVVSELRDTVHSAIEQTNQTQTSHLGEIQRLHTRVTELEQDLASCQTSLNNIREQVNIRDIHLQQKNFKINELSRQVSSQHEDIKILSGQRDRLQELMAGDSGKPQMYSAMALLRHARRERDAAIERRYSMEKDLQQTKYEVIVLNHQLMEAIHQKNKVSQLLDQWQSDMANLLGVKVEIPAKSVTSQSAANTISTEANAKSTDNVT
ncbi:bicaudal D-related protein homolog [Dreissena polymorpha]|uniref:Uncharacterized protein n=1 Tax=Dreissena polymorpha TaxID=45954 RepID=A0A9D4NBP1_DREPO|nr:bicaudal D-related protein homolog [Dreissena polymorpha]KAH3891445.1 hypothetical protein DPMN_015547 [Dreissena polymorpha]